MSIFRSQTAFELLHFKSIQDYLTEVPIEQIGNTEENHEAPLNEKDEEIEIERERL